MSDLTLRQAQREQPWTVTYKSSERHLHDLFRSTFAGKHSVLHALKSLGKIAALFEANDHDEEHGTLTDDQVTVLENMTADLVTTAIRIANVFRFDLEAVLRRRVLEKNGVGFS